MSDLHLKIRKEIERKLHEEEKRFSSGKITPQNVDRRSGYCEGLYAALHIVSAAIKQNGE